jgi:polysaccharide export outer membrane protein
VVQLGGMTIPSAEKAIARALESGNYIARPQVTILLLQRRGNQVSVLGQVNRPGRYPLETVRTRLSEVLAVAGGIGPGGADVVIVSGTREGKPFRLEVDLAGLYVGDRNQTDPIVAGDDVVYVHRMPMFYIYGEVQRPGSFRVERGMTMRQALAQAGGPTGRGTERGMRVYRRNASNAVEMLAPELDDPVKADDVLYVRETIF